MASYAKKVSKEVQRGIGKGVKATAARVKAAIEGKFSPPPPHAKKPKSQAERIKASRTPAKGYKHKAY